MHRANNSILGKSGPKGNPDIDGFQQTRFSDDSGKWFWWKIWYVRTGDPIPEQLSETTKICYREIDSYISHSKIRALQKCYFSNIGVLGFGKMSVSNNPNRHRIQCVFLVRVSKAEKTDSRFALSSCLDFIIICFFASHWIGSFRRSGRTLDGSTKECVTVPNVQLIIFAGMQF